MVEAGSSDLVSSGRLASKFAATGYSAEYYEFFVSSMVAGGFYFPSSVAVSCGGIYVWLSSSFGDSA